jgi:NADH dehydrogenase
VDVLVVDRNNYHTFQALLYQVAAAELEPEEISYPVRSILRGLSNVRFAMAEVEDVDLKMRVLKTRREDIPYDYLVLAAGSVSHFFGVPGASEHAFELKTLDQAIDLRNHILCCLEAAVHETEELRRRALLTFAIVGGGPTGVEFAGALSELLRGPIAKDYPMLKSEERTVVLLEAGDRLLSHLPERLSQYTQKRLRRMRVDVQFDAMAEGVTPQGVRLRESGFLPAETVVWTAGVRGDSLAEQSGLPLAKDSRVSVLPTLQVPEYPEVYVVGDLAYFEQDGRPLPFVAQVAMQQGKRAAENIKRQVKGLDPQNFRYDDKGTMATIGRRAAVAHVWGRGFTGFPAWLLWLGVHVFNLIGFRNRLLVMINWAWDFVFYERAVRLILPSETCSKRMYGLPPDPGG